MTDSGTNKRIDNASGFRALGAILTLLFTACFAVDAPAQEALRGVPQRYPSTPAASMFTFDRTLNTFLWAGALNVQREFGSTWLGLHQMLRSRLVRTEFESIQDEVNTNLDIISGLGGGWNVRAQARSSFLTDTRGLELSDLSQHGGLAGAQYDFPAGFSIAALGGFEFVRQEGEKEDGFTYLGEIAGRGLLFERFVGSLRARSGGSFLDVRSPRTDSIAVSLHRDFGGGSSNALRLNYVVQRRELYTPADSALQQAFAVRKNILQRDAAEFFIADDAIFRLGSQTVLTASIGVLGNSIGRVYRYKNYAVPSSVILDTNIEEFRYYGAASLSGNLTGWLLYDVSASYDEREERHEVKEDPRVSDPVFDRQDEAARRRSNIAKRTTAATRLSSIESRDSLVLEGSASLLRYDTPDTLNTDDRDELLLTVGISETHNFSRYFAGTVSLDATLSHLVYLHRFESANNNWNRILRLRARTDYHPSPGFRTVNIAEVLGNYTVYDFDEQVLTVRSFSFRQVSWIDSTRIAFGRLSAFDFAGSIRIYERGLLKWDDFKERPENYFVEYFAWPQFRVTPVRHLHVSVGYRIFAQERYRYEGSSRVHDRRFVSRGPTGAIVWERGAFERVRFEGWLESQVTDGQVTRKVSNFSVTVGFLI